MGKRKKRIDEVALRTKHGDNIFIFYQDGRLNVECPTNSAPIVTIIDDRDESVVVGKIDVLKEIANSDQFLAEPT